METNPYESPTIERQRLNRGWWRNFWRTVCIASLAAATAALVVGNIIAVTWPDTAERTSLILVADGLVALGELVAWTLFGVSGIGWLLSRRAKGVTETSPPRPRVLN